MARAFVIEGARITCQYGQCEACLSVPEDRHIAAYGSLFANETDIRTENISRIKNVSEENGEDNTAENTEENAEENAEEIVKETDKGMIVENVPEVFRGMVTANVAETVVKGTGNILKKAWAFLNEDSSSTEDKGKLEKRIPEHNSKKNMKKLPPTYNFETCRSPYRVEYSAELKEYTGTSERAEAELSALGFEMPGCNLSSVIPWQNVNETVHIGSCSGLSLAALGILDSADEGGTDESPNQWKAKTRLGDRALMENGWTLCLEGMGIISLVSTGQPDEDRAQELLERLDELERLVDLYMKENNIDESQREGLFDSILLWGGYLNQDTFWEYESTVVNRDFCKFLQKQDPYLYNFFGRGIYLEDKQGEIIDLSYMLGINKGVRQGRIMKECIGDTLFSDRGMRNGYYEACRGSHELGSGDFLREFLTGFLSEEYDAQGRYEDYYNAARKEIELLHNTASDLPQRPISEDEYGGLMEDLFTQYFYYTTTDVKWKERKEEANSRAQRFLNLLQEDMQRGNQR